MVQILLCHGADANRLTSDGYTTALHIAAERGFAAVVSELLDCGANADGLCTPGTCGVACRQLVQLNQLWAVVSALRTLPNCCKLHIVHIAFVFELLGK